MLGNNAMHSLYIILMALVLLRLSASQEVSEEDSVTVGTQNTSVNRTYECEENPKIKEIMAQVFVLDNKLNEGQHRIQELEQQVKQLNSTVERHMPANLTQVLGQRQQLQTVTGTEIQLDKKITCPETISVVAELNWKGVMTSNTSVNRTSNCDIQKIMEQVNALDYNLRWYQYRSQELERQIKKLNNTVETHIPAEWTRECQQRPHLPEIKQVVQEFINNKYWSTLRRNLEAVLDHDSEEYKHLQQLGWPGSLFSVGLHGYTQLASLLLCAGLPVDLADMIRSNMLHGAAWGGHLQLVKLLLDHSACVDMRGWNSNTPLTLAAGEGYLDVVQYLVQAGANTTASNEIHESALYRARNKNKTSVAEYLSHYP